MTVLMGGESPDMVGCTRIEYLRAQLERYREIAASAESDGSWQAAVRAEMQADKIRADLDQLIESDSVSDIPDTVEAHRTQVLQHVRRLRCAAEASNSFVAASGLLKLESDLLAEREARLRDATPEGASSPDEIVDNLRRRIKGLPDTVRLKLEPLLEALSADG